MTRRDTAKAKGLVAVVGCGRLGSHLADTLSLEGRDVVVMDVNARAFANLSSSFSGFTVEGDATEMSALEQVRLHKAGALLACTDRDNVNIFVAQVAREVFGVSRIMARVYDDSREDLCRSLGIETVCPARVAGGIFLAGLHGKEA